VSLNLKNPRARQLAGELSKLTGESLTTVVIRALEDRLAAERARHGAIRKSDQILAFAQRFAARLPAGISSEGHAELFGEDGLPK
jgi:antitoxin VapB